MLSGNGRHRRPRQAPAIVVAAGVTGSAIALPLLGAASAHAADGATWDRLADCETGGDWHAVPGNGHYGGLQLSQETWTTYGGLHYALSPDRASRSDQIAVAEKVLADKGPAAWPGCAVLAGLTPETPEPSASPSDSSGSGSESPDPSASSDPGTEPSASASPSGSSGSSGDPGAESPSTSGSPEPSATATGTGSASPGDDGTSAGTGSSGRHRGDGADEGAGSTGSGDSAGRHASRGGSGAEGDDQADGDYVVRPGDNLWAIAQAHDLDGGWPALYAANKETVGDDPDLILPGQRLELS